MSRSRVVSIKSSPISLPSELSAYVGMFWNTLVSLVRVCTCKSGFTCVAVPSLSPSAFDTRFSRVLSFAGGRITAMCWPIVSGVNNAFSLGPVCEFSMTANRRASTRERKAANEDVNQFKELSQFLEYVFEREMKKDAFAVLSAMIPIVKAIGASESTVDYIVRSPLEWVKNERRYADNVANYVIHEFAKETEFAVR
eukprot:jgi/Mesvir1/1129/Mv17636-RA.1